MQIAKLILARLMAVGFGLCHHIHRWLRPRAMQVCCCLLLFLPLLTKRAAAKDISVVPGEEVIASGTWAYLNCTTSNGLGNYVVTIQPTFGTATPSTASEPVPGCPTGSPSLPVTIARYTMNKTSPPVASDYFQLNYVLNGRVYGPIDIYVLNGNIVGKQLGGCDTCNKQLVGEPVDVASGNVFYSVTDYSTAGQNSLTFKRYYNSLGNLATQIPLPESTEVLSSTLASELGSNWRSSYDRYLKFTSPTSVIAERPDGQQIIFILDGSTWSPDSDIDATLVQQGNQWEFTDRNDTVETYTTVTLLPGVSLVSLYAQLDSIRLRNGYTQTLTYSGQELSNVTDSYNRSLGFTYSGKLLQSVTTPDGLVMSYSYTAAANSNRLTGVSYSTTPETHQSYVYEVAAQPFVLTGIIDENGSRYATWGYDPVGRGTSDHLGTGANSTTITYNSDGSSVVTNAFGVQDTYAFKTLQDIPKVVEIDRQASSTTAAAKRLFTYDSNGYLASQTDWNGSKTSYVNDVHGQPTTIAEPTRTATISYDSNFSHLPHQIVTPGLTTAFVYDSDGNPLTRTDLDTTTQTVPYSSNGQTRTWTYTWNNFLLASIRTPRTAVVNRTGFTYDGTGALTQISNGLNQNINVTAHTGGGLPLTIVDPNGVTTAMTYDGRQRLTSRAISTASGVLTTTYTFDPTGELSRVTLPDSSFIAYTYDTAHRVTGVTDALNNQSQDKLDALGDITALATYNNNNKITKQHSATFDALGRMLTDVGGVGQTTTYSYDNNGNALNVGDPLSHTATQVFDALNRLTMFTDANSASSQFVYDAHDRPITVNAPNAEVTSYVRNGFGDVIQETSPDRGKTIYYYNLDGEVTQRIDARSTVSNYTYDAIDRVLTATYPANTAENETYVYDQSGHGFGIGKLTSVTDAAGSLSRSYDERGDLVSESRVTGGTTLRTTYSYDAASRVSAIVYPSETTISYARDGAGRITQVTAKAPRANGPSAVVSGITYQPFGTISGMTFGNGINEVRTFDLDYRVGNLTDSGTAKVQNLTYAYDAADNPLSIANGVSPSANQVLTYDVINRLVKASGSYGNFTYTYGKAGNMLTKTNGTTTTSFSYVPNTNILMQLSVGGFATQTLGHNPAGNINTLSPGITGATNVITAFYYNQNERMHEALNGVTPVATYTYDAFGKRIVKTTSVTTLYQYDRNGNLLEEASGAGTGQVDYIYLDGSPVATLNPATGALYFLHNDRLGTPQLATDNGQAVAWKATYQPYGGTLANVSGLITQNLRLPGQQFDAETGLNHNGFRDYDPYWGRYVEADPIGLAGGLNAFRYGNANPGKFVDPHGLWANLYFGSSASAWQSYFVNDPGTFTILGEGSTGVFDRLNPKGENLSPADLAWEIYTNPNYVPGMPVEIYACNAGTGGNDSFAKQVALDLNALTAGDNNNPSIVWGPNGLVSPFVQGSNVVPQAEWYAGLGAFWFHVNGKWIGYK